MRRLFLLFLVVLLACPFLAGCNVRGKINEKITEKILEESLGSNIDFAIDGEGITAQRQRRGKHYHRQYQMA